MLKLIAVFSALCLMAIGSAHAEPRERPNKVKQRCNDDQIADAATARGRNAWARRCGHIDLDDEMGNNARGKYAVFNIDAPRNEWEPCTDDVTYLADCLIGCFASNQKLRFEGRYFEIEQAAQQEASTITVLNSKAKLSKLSFADTPIAHFVRGRNEHDLVEIQATTGEVIVVTGNHPMVDAQGAIVRADHVEAGDALLGEAGELLIDRVRTVEHHGDVWNVSPASADVLSNINVAQGFLTGSVRFQNEWAYDEFRLMLRKRLDANGL